MARTMQLGVILSEPITKELGVACAGEFLACLLFLFITVTNVSVTVQKDAAFVGTPAETGSLSSVFNSIAQTFGFAIFVLVYMFAGVSGAHINPAVTFSQVLGKRCSAVKGGLFVVSQCVGAIVGAAFAKVVGGDRYEALGSGAANEVFAPHSIGGAFLGEVLMTSVLCTTVLAATNATITKQFSHNGALLPFTVGMAVFLGHQVLIPVTNCSINPARSFGASVVANYWADHWLFWVAPLLGGAISTGLWETVLCPEEVEDKTSTKSMDEETKREVV